VEVEERGEVGLAALVEPAEVERERIGDHEEDENENVRERRSEIARELTA
jgi:hypothetical protein